MKPSCPPEIELRPGESIDNFLDGRLRLIQSCTGYRFSVDAVLLSEFATVKHGDLVVDLGTGCGIIPILMLLTMPVGYAVGLEIQPELAGQAARNAVINGLEQRMGVISGDIKHAPLPPSSVDVVICNPPYRRKESGRINPDPRRAIARHEILISIDDLLDSVRGLLRPKGKFAIIYPAARLTDIMSRMRGFNLEPKRMRMVYFGQQSEAKLVLIEALAGGREGLKILSPLFGQDNIHD